MLHSKALALDFCSMGNADQIKKRGERYFLQEFLKLMPELTELSPIDSEAPDFLFDVAGARIGIEVTRCFLPSDQRTRAVESYRERLARELQQEHRGSGLLPAHVSVHMHKETAFLTTSRRELLKRELLTFVSGRIPPPGPHVEFDFEVLPQPLLELGVEDVWILNQEIEPSWCFGYANSLPESCSSIIQDILNQKAPRIAKYRKKADKVWLLILSGTEGLHSIVHFDRDILSHEYSTDFDRVFLFRTFGPVARELRIGRKSAAKPATV